MAITNKFRVYGESSTNLLSDSAYNDNSVRTGGAQAGQSISSSITNTALKTASIIGIAFIDALGLRNTASTVSLGLSDSIADLRDKLKALIDGFVGDRMSSFTDTLTNHVGNTSNPHSVTKSQVGLGSVVDTGDSATPTDGGTTKFTTGGAYTELNKKVDKTTKVNGHALSGDVTVTKSDVGLGSVVNKDMDNSPTSSSDNYVKSGGVYTALAGKANLVTSPNRTKLLGVDSSGQPKMTSVSFSGSKVSSAANADNAMTAIKLSKSAQDYGFYTYGSSAKAIVNKTNITNAQLFEDYGFLIRDGVPPASSNLNNWLPDRMIFHLCIYTGSGYHTSRCEFDQVELPADNGDTCSTRALISVPNASQTTYFFVSIKRNSAMSYDIRVEVGGSSLISGTAYWSITSN